MSLGKGDLNWHGLAIHSIGIDNASAGAISLAYFVRVITWQKYGNHDLIRLQFDFNRTPGLLAEKALGDEIIDIYPSFP
jgi:hypothetical protein